LGDIGEEMVVDGCDH